MGSQSAETMYLLTDSVRSMNRWFAQVIGFNKISHENISGKRAASGGAGLIVSGPAKKGKGRRKRTLHDSFRSGS